MRNAMSLRGAEQWIHCKSDETMFLPLTKAMRRWRDEPTAVILPTVVILLCSDICQMGKTLIKHLKKWQRSFENAIFHRY
jgi:hypothetical protein